MIGKVGNMLSEKRAAEESVMIQAGEGAIEEQPLEDVLAQESYKIRLALAELNPADLEKDFENWQTDKESYNQKVKELCWEFANRLSKEDQVGLMLYGPAGVGKSHLAAAMCKVLIKRGISVLKVKVPDLLAGGRSSFAEEEVRDVLEKLRRAKVLWLDDMTTDHLACAFESKKAAEMLYRVIDQAVENKQVLIITTNHKPEDLKSRLFEIDGSDRIYDRLRELVHPVEVRGKSQRGSVRDKNSPKWLMEKLAELKGQH